MYLVEQKKKPSRMGIPTSSVNERDDSDTGGVINDDIVTVGDDDSDNI